jgi:mannose-1-phosphate guanylyltransferase
VERLRPVIPPERMWVLTNDFLRGNRAAASGGARAPDPGRTGAAQHGAGHRLAAHILQSIDPDAVMGVFPADHVIAKEGRYRQLLRTAFRAAERGQIVVLGILPRWPETGYGYIEFPRGIEPGAKPVAIRCFQEKPDARTARRYVKSGRFYWNAGMFFWRADVLLDELRRSLPRTASLLAALPAFADAAFLPKLREVFPSVREHFDRLRGARKGAGVSPESRVPKSAGTTWEAGTRSTSFCRAMRTEMSCRRRPSG